MSYVYHLKPKNLQTNIIYPLNQLNVIFPDLAKSEYEKYLGREEIMEYKISPLNCFWNDVLFFSAINPLFILNTLKDLGFESSTRKIEVIRIPITFLEEKNTVVFTPKDGQNHFDYLPFIKNEYKELDKVSEEQISSWKKLKENNQKILWFTATMHVVTKNPIDIKNCEIFNIN